MISLIITLVVVGFVLYLIQAYIPMDPMIKNIISVVVIICALLYVLSAFGYGHNALLR